jgi:hypothetical protein
MISMQPYDNSAPKSPRGHATLANRSFESLFVHCNLWPSSDIAFQNFTPWLKGKKHYPIILNLNIFHHEKQTFFPYPHSNAPRSQLQRQSPGWCKPHF